MRLWPILALSLGACVLGNPEYNGESAGASDTSGEGTTSAGAATLTTTSTSTTTTTTSASASGGTEGGSTGAETSTGDASTTAPGVDTSGSTGAECPDGDVDGHCDDADNCPDLANPDQADNDMDGLGDPCDPCDHDGPNPPAYPASVGPAQEITISNASINGGGTFITVAPGAPLSVSYHWKVNFCACMGCYTQGMIGIAGHPPGQCFYNWGAEKNCMNWEGDVVMEFTAPQEPGIHRFRAARTWDFDCQLNLNLDDASAEFAAICVD